MPQGLMIGTRIRERRLLRGLRQSDLARQAGVSPSYLNLIEHNRRRIAGKTLLRIAAALEVEPAVLSEGAEAALLSGLREAAGEPRADGPELGRTEEFAGRFPGWAGLLVDLHRRTEALERTIGTLTDRLAHDPFLADSLHEVLSAVTAIRSTSSILVETEALEPEWQARFHRNINEDSARLAEGAEALVRYLEGGPDRDAEIASPQDEMHAFLAMRRFHFPELEAGGAEALAGPLAEAQAAGLSAAAQSLLRSVLLRCLEDARALPIGPFLDGLANVGLHPDRLAEATGADLALVFRRLAALPEAEVGPVGLVICDASGTLIFRKPLAGFVMPRQAGACVLWPLFRVLARPEAPLRRRIRQAGRGGVVVEALAAASEASPARFDRPALLRGHMLLLPDPGASGGAVQEVGVSCRICPVAECVARREPSILAEVF